MSQSAASRMRRHRARRAAGLIALRIEVDEARLVDVLTQSRRLHPSKSDDPESIRKATEDLVASLRLEERS